MSRRFAAAALLLAIGLTGACGGTGTGEVSSAEPSRTLSSVPPSGRTPSPTRPPAPPPPKVGPSTPSDYIEGDMISGRVVKGGSGPCYAVVNDDNQRFALHNAAGLALAEGSYITAKVGPLLAKIDCGEGIPYELISFKRL
ncbi:hypothetical protein Ais01nite_34650 [Asanoa ishikariensis]|uniref:Uncharacterized protein n=1 Tax=Asanoa ishikariensis TaxID=137265 RepID=A0A1H3LEZ5_9ACTN|nr:hypothetical protein [Asanoa ishikariensis]GIF65430.1 hypothetical protein Ais01nite_34650 [Asanoa ishikariensis]SDY62870.1 hypothetical protein SAMN05421684_0706 [Asanoa ishikariensis]